MIPTLHPYADLARRYHENPRIELEVNEVSAVNADGKFWWEINNQAQAAFRQGNSYEALILAKKALAMKPDAIATLHNVSIILESMGRFKQAFGYAKKAYELEPDYDPVSAHYAEACLRMERWQEGWPLYVKNRGSMDWVRNWLPEWEGQDVCGKKIVAIEGGGYGDDLYFLRNLVLLRDQGVEVTLICQPSFCSLVEAQGMRAIANWDGNCDVDWRDYDYYTPLLSLGQKQGIAWNGPYVKGTLPWWKKLRRNRVGFCSRAGEAKSYDRKYRSLHNEQAGEILRALPKKYKWVNMIHQMHHDMLGESAVNGDWLDTANVMSTLDLMVTVDTGVAHLAGAMNVPCWVILPGAAAWQYPLWHEIHPFYPSMRIFRNESEGLDDAVQQVAEALEIL